MKNQLPELWKWIRRYVFQAGPESTEIIDQYFATLSAKFERVKQDKKLPPEQAAMIPAVEALFKKRREWRAANQIDQLLVNFMSGPELDVELGRRIVDAETTLAGEKHKFYIAARKAQKRPEGQRALLGRLVNDLQWQDEISYVKSHYIKSARIRAIFVFFLSFVLFFLPFFVKLFGGEWEQDARTLLILDVIFAGMIGAAFSLLVRLNARLESNALEYLRMAAGWAFIGSRVAIGMGASLTLFYFMQSSMLSGEIFPEFWNGVLSGVPDGIVTDEYYRNQGKLIIMGIVAGFSESLVPNLLRKQGGKVGSK